MTDDGGLWHGRRLDAGWAPFDAPLAAGIRRAGCSYEPGGRVNVLAVTTDGRLLHGRHLPGMNWITFDEVLADVPGEHFANVTMAVPG